MTFLLLSILFNALVFIFFKWIAAREVHTFRVVVFNYFFAALTGLSITGAWNFMNFTDAPWLLPTVLLGMTFVFVFYLMAYTTREAGVAKAVIANKLSLIIPVLAGFYLYHDAFTFLKITGIILSIPAIYFIAKTKSLELDRKSIWLVVSLFVVSGFLDSTIKFIQHYRLPAGLELTFTTYLFVFACLTGFIALLFIRKKDGRITWKKDVGFGLILGLINVGSIYFLVKALQIPDMESSMLFPLNNLAVIFGAGLTGWIVFGEKLVRQNYIGILLALVSLILLFLSNI